MTDELVAWLRDPAAGWSVGTFGALAEFVRDPDETADVSPDGMSVVTPRGGIRVLRRPETRPMAWERRAGRSWTHAVAFCLPAGHAAGPGRTVVTELGPDRSALRAGDRDGVLVDLGVGAPHLEACVRTDDPELLAVLRAAEGQPLFTSDAAAALIRASPHRVFRTALARAEVYTAIPPPTGASPDGPHTHLLPRLLAHGRTHAATDPIPDGWVPCVAVHPPHPSRELDGRPGPRRPERHERFQSVLARWGAPTERAAKEAVMEALAASSSPPAWALERSWRPTVELVLRQGEELTPRHPHLAGWRRRLPREDDGPDAPLTHDPAQG